MDIACMRWRPLDVDGETVRYGRKWGERKASSPVSDLTLEVVSSFLHDSADRAPQPGNFLVEFVEPDPDEVDEITDLLRPVFGDNGGMIAEFITMSNPVSDFSQFSVTAGVIDDDATVHFRALDWMTIRPGKTLDESSLVACPIRLVARASAVVVAWRAPVGYPSLPPRAEKRHTILADRLPGTIIERDYEAEARERGEPEWLIRFEHWAGYDCASQLSQLIGEWEDEETSAGGLAEELLRRCILASREAVAEDLPREFEEWEADVLGRSRSSASLDEFALSSLNKLGTMVNMVDDNRRTIRGPTGEPEYYFTRTKSSDAIGSLAEESGAAAAALRERVRTGLSLVSAVSTSQALKIARESQRSSEHFQRVVSVLGAAVLGPALVAGLFGANTALPGRDKWWGFALMLVLMVAAAAAIFGLLKRSDRQASQSLEDRAREP